MALFGFPMFGLDTLLYRGAGWLSDKAEEYGTQLFEWASPRQPTQEQQPVSQGTYVEADGTRRAIDPETGYTYATRSESQDIRADLREPAIQALQEQAHAMGKELPADFVQYMRFSENPVWNTLGGGKGSVSIFHADGSFNTDLNDTIMAKVANGELQAFAEQRDRLQAEQGPALGRLNPQILDIIEGVNDGMKLPTQVREALVNDRYYEYKDEQGHNRVIDFTKSDVRFQLDEIRELSQQFLNGKSIDIPNDQVAAMQTAVNAVLESKQQGRA